MSILSADEVMTSAKAPNAMVHRIPENERWIGGAVTSINAETQHNRLDLLHESIGEIGREVWLAIMAHYFDTKVGMIRTSYSEMCVSTRQQA